MGLRKKMKADKIKRNKGNPLSCIRTVIRRGGAAVVREQWVNAKR